MKKHDPIFLITLLLCLQTAGFLLAASPGSAADIIRVPSYPYMPPSPPSYDKGYQQPARPYEPQRKYDEKKYDDSESAYPTRLIEGYISVLNPGANSMILRVSKATGGSCYRECEFELDEKTFFIENKKVIAPDSVGTDSKVRFKYIEKEGKRFPRTIIVLERKIPQPQSTDVVETRKDRSLVKAPPELTITNIALYEQSGDGILDADEKGAVKVTLKNTGKGPGFDVNIKLSLSGESKGIKFNEKSAAGTIQPGEEKTIEILIAASLDIKTADMEFKATAVEANGFDSKPLILAFKTKELVPPLIQITNVDIHDVDGKRVLSKGKEATVTLTIHNTGPGPARNVTAFIETGSEEVRLFSNKKVGIGTLQPGDSQKASFNIAVTQRYQGANELPVQFFIKEKRDRYSVRPGIKLALGEEPSDIKVVRVEARETPQIKTEAFDDINIAPSFSQAQRAFSDDDIAVVIGVEKYQNLPMSEFSYNDAKSVRGYFKALGFADRNMEFITDEKATLSGIVKSIENWLPNRVKKNSRVLVYYSGHGSPDPATGEPYLVPHDGDPNYLSSTAYPLKRLYASLAKLGGGEVMVVVDSCFSGAGGRSVLAKGARPALAKIEDPLLAAQNMAVLSSTEGTQISTSMPDREHGVFTYYFLKAIKDGRKDLVDVYNYIRPLVEDEARRRNVSQVPAIKPGPETMAGRFILRK